MSSGASGPFSGTSPSGRGTGSTPARTDIPPYPMITASTSGITASMGQQGPQTTDLNASSSSLLSSSADQTTAGGTGNPPYPILPASSNPSGGITDIGQPAPLLASSSRNQIASGASLAYPTGPAFLGPASQNQVGGSLPSSSNVITPPPLLIPTPSTGPQQSSASSMSSDGVPIGAMLFGLVKSANSISDQIAKSDTKSKFIDEIDNTQSRLHSFYLKHGRSEWPPKDNIGCSGGSQKSKRGLGSLLGNVLDTVKCAYHSVDKLEQDVKVDKPEFSKIKGDLPDIGTLAGDIDPDDEEDKDKSSQSDTKSEPETQTSSTQSSLTSSGASTTASSSSTSSGSSTASSTASFSDPCLGGLVTTSIVGLGRRGEVADACPQTCPDPLPTMPTDGPLAVTFEPIDEGDIEAKIRRDIAGRVDLHKRLNQAEKVTTYNACPLTTPRGSPVSTPVYSGGAKVWREESQNILPASWRQVSRYYRDTVAPHECAPTVTAVSLNEMVGTGQGNGDAKHTFPTTDHSCEISAVSSRHRVIADPSADELNWLKGFMESLVAPAPKSSTAQQNAPQTNAPQQNAPQPQNPQQYVSV